MTQTIGIIHDKKTNVIYEVLDPSVYCVHNIGAVCNYVYKKYKGKALYSLTKESDYKAGDVFDAENHNNGW